MGVLRTEPPVKWQYQVHTSESTAPRKEMCHSGILHRELVAQTVSIRLTRAKVLLMEMCCTTKRDVPQWRACPEWNQVSSELAYETNSTVHFGSTFLGVHLDSTFVVTCERRSKVMFGKHNPGGAVDLRVKVRGALG